MANTTLNSTLTCNYPDISSLLDKAIANQTNMTLSIRACPDLCQSAWGVGSPDLSGIGAYVSYTFEVVLVMFFAACSLWTYWPPNPLYFAKLKILMRSFHDNTAFVVIAFFFAAIIRSNKKDTAMYELSFAQSLLSMQVCCYISAYISSSSVALMRPSDSPRTTVADNEPVSSQGESPRTITRLIPSLKKTQRTSERSIGRWWRKRREVTAVGFFRRVWISGIKNLFFLTICVLGLVFLFAGNRRSRAEIRAIDELFAACPGQRYLRPALTTSGIASGASSWLGFILASVFMFAGYVMTVVLFAFMSFGRPFYPVVSAAIGGVGIWKFKEMNGKRKLLKNLMRDEFHDDDWSYGQILAVFIWFPVTWQIIAFLKDITIAAVRVIRRGSANRSADSIHGAESIAGVSDKEGSSAVLLEEPPVVSAELQAEFEQSCRDTC